MKIRMTRTVLPEVGLVKDAVLEVVYREASKLAVKSAKGFPVWVDPDEYVEVKDEDSAD